jgi:hypothetical protein
MIRLGSAYLHNVILNEENVFRQVVISTKRTKFSGDKTGNNQHI